MKNSIVINADFAVTTRKSLGLNQADFWSPLGVSQSGGSRYESGRTMPGPVRKMMYLHYVVGLDANIIKRLSRV
ncbi:MAG: hypothetical protein BGO63_03845 [Candidatus Accumulibacter sp. 66-26]|nr:MAG: hypothetical protein BGO63_03845 [Candidatus Accumulibacter sp. 66-26]